MNEFERTYESQMINYLRKQVDDLWVTRRKLMAEGWPYEEMKINRIQIELLVEMLYVDFDYDYYKE